MIFEFFEIFGRTDPDKGSPNTSDPNLDDGPEDNPCVVETLVEAFDTIDLEYKGPTDPLGTYMKNYF